MTDYQQIVWLASYPKSGNTWLRLFIEAYLLGDFNLNEINCSVQDSVSTRWGAGVGEDVRKLPIDVQMLMRPVSLFRLVHMYLENRPVENFPLLVKTHSANINANGITMIPPQLTKKVLHIVRDPRDVCVSFAKHMGMDIDDAIEHMQNEYECLAGQSHQAKTTDFISSWKMHTKSYVEGDLVDSLTVRYEDMLESPVETFSGILEHIGITPDESRVSEALERVELSKLREKEKAEGFKEASPKNQDQFFGKGGSNSRDALKPYQVKRIEKMAGKYLELFGYKGNGNKHHGLH